MKTYEKDGNAWKCTEADDQGNVISVYNVDSNLNWNQLRESLFTSTPFQRALQNPQLVNSVAYGALQTILSTEGNEQYLKAMLSNLMAFTPEEITELNKILSDNNFTISL